MFLGQCPFYSISLPSLFCYRPRYWSSTPSSFVCEDGRAQHRILFITDIDFSCLLFATIWWMIRFDEFLRYNTISSAARWKTLGKVDGLVDKLCLAALGSDFCWPSLSKFFFYVSHNFKCVCSYISRDIRPDQFEHMLLRVPSLYANFYNHWEVVL